MQTWIAGYLTIGIAIAAVYLIASVIMSRSALWCRVTVAVLVIVAWPLFVVAALGMALAKFLEGSAG